MKNILFLTIRVFFLTIFFLIKIVHSSLSQSNFVSLVKDIGKANTGGNIGIITPINDKIALFYATDEFYGRELWRTDGTEKGTYLVKDIYPGLRGSRFDPPYDDTRRQPIVFNGIMYFTAFTNISSSSNQIWRSDGTELGTYPITDDPNGVSQQPHLQIHKNAIYFWDGSELYRSEGTKESTKLVKRVKNQHEIKDMVEMNGKFWFTTSDYIWQTDGTEKGTIPVIPFKYLSAHQLSVVNNKLFFRADQPLRSTLWQSDGTISGTKIVREAIAGVWSNIWSAKNIAYFIGEENTLWRSDGTLKGTYQLTTTSPRQIFVYKDELYFTLPINRNSQKGQIWKSDGTVNGTRAIIDLTPEADNYSFPINISEQNGVLYFYSDAGSTISNSIDQSLKRQKSGFWSSDGTPNGTKLIYPLSNNKVKIIPSPVYNEPFFYYTVEYNNAPANILMNGYALFIGNEFENNGGGVNKYGSELYRMLLK